MAIISEEVDITDWNRYDPEEIEQIEIENRIEFNHIFSTFNGKGELPYVPRKRS